ncbi:hypothetical protein BH24ACI2_BH24ACI2_13080 [soil metagenome]|nr:hypothetical protein [Acidobacteriota bacterium]
MKYCPSCQTSYTDDTLKFCLQDGTPLVEVSNSRAQIPTIAFGEGEAETVISPKSREPIRRVEPLEIENYQREPVQEERITDVHPKTKKSNTALIVALTTLATLLVLGGAIGAWFYFKDGKTEIAQNTNNKVAVNQNSVSKNNSNAEISPLPTASVKISTPTPAPTFNPETVKNEVSDKIYLWQSATEVGDINGYMNNYADTIDYYNKRGASRSFVQNDKQKAFSKFDNIEINLSNLRVTPDASGENATAVFDKEWRFEGEKNYSAGKVQTQLKLKKINGKWLITSERDLKVYYTE